MIVNYNSIHEHENSNINERISPNVKLYLNRLKQHVPNIQIRFFGSITNFTHFKNKSDVDCCITYPDEYTKNKLIQFVTEDTIKFNIKRITFQQMKFSNPNYKDEFQDVYCVFFDNGDKIDINLIPYEIGPITLIHHNTETVFLIFLYILKLLYYRTDIISKDVFVYLKRNLFKIKHYINNSTEYYSYKQVIKDSDS